MGNRYKPLVRSGASGAAAAVLDFAAMALLVELAAVRYGPAAFAASLLGAMLCFVLNRYWAFGDQSPLGWSQLKRFVGIVLGAALAVACAVHVFAHAFDLPYLVAKALAAIIVFASWTYPMQARIFRQGVRYEATH